jgi:hypothetical protein
VADTGLLEEFLVGACAEAAAQQRRRRWPCRAALVLGVAVSATLEHIRQ